MTVGNGRRSTVVPLRTHRRTKVMLSIKRTGPTCAATKATASVPAVPIGRGSRYLHRRCRSSPGHTFLARPRGQGNAACSAPSTECREGLRCCIRSALCTGRSLDPLVRVQTCVAGTQGHAVRSTHGGAGDDPFRPMLRAAHVRRWSVVGGPSRRRRPDPAERKWNSRSTTFTTPWK
jgi:hypothetical protein